MSQWSIKIVAAASGKGAAFQPNVPGYNQGDALPAQDGDAVFWSNMTADTHQPWPTHSDYSPLSEADVLPRGSANYLSDPIPGQEPSTPLYNVAQPSPTQNNWTVYYYCRLHPTIETERGTIAATVRPTE